MGLKNTPPSMFVESKIFGNFKFDSPPGPLFMWSYLIIALDIGLLNYQQTINIPGFGVGLSKNKKR